MVTVDVLDAADLAACRVLLEDGSKSFHAASRLLPARIAVPATALYAFCRVADDAVDLDDSPAALASLQGRLADIYAGVPQDTAADRAMAAVVARYEIPRAIPDALIEGFAWDRAGRQYENFPDLTAYATRVAGTVGVMMALLMGERRPAVIARACDLGIAMQLTNIARDVGEDARNGRLYLPHDWLREEGIVPADFIASPTFTPALGRVVARLLGEAKILYRRAAGGIAKLPLDCRPGIGAARLIYSAIGDAVALSGYDSVGARAVVGSRRKLTLLGRSCLAVLWPGGAIEAPPLEAAGFLVAAVAAKAPGRAGGEFGWAPEERMIRFLDLLERLGEARRFERVG
jgi:15-cis-phytoene synthase